MKSKKRILSVLLAVAIFCTMSPLAPAGAAVVAQHELEAKALSAMGLFQGYDSSGANFGLADRVSREQAVIFLIRMLGEEKAAQAWTGSAPFTDVPTGNWAYAYIGYAKEKGYTVGLSNNEFGLGRNANMQEMTMFALRGLGYSDASGVMDFDYNGSLSFAKDIGILTSSKAVTPFTRDEAVGIIFNSIGTDLKGQDSDLLSKLMSTGIVTQAQYDKALAIMSVNTPTDGVTGVTISPASVSLKVGLTAQLTANVVPANAKNKEVAWSSNNTSVATVDKNGLVTAVKPGTATITAKTTDGGKTGTRKVTVPAGNKVATASFKMLNSTGKSIVDLYIADSALDSYGEDFLTAHNYASWNNGKTITRDFEFYPETEFDFFLRFSDGTEMEATGLNFTGMTAANPGITFTKDAVKLTVAGQVYRTAKGVTQQTGDNGTKKLTDRFNASVASYNTLVNKCIALGLDKDAAFAKSMDELAVEIDKMGTVINKGTTLTTAQVTEYTKNLNALDKFITEMEKLIKSAGTTTANAASTEVIKRFNKSLTRYNSLIAAYNKLGITDAAFTQSMNELTGEIDKMTAVINKGDGLTTAQVKEYTDSLNALDTFMNEMDQLIAAGESNSTSAASALLLERYNKATTRYNAILDQLTKLGLNKDPEMVSTIDSLTQVVNELGTSINKSALTTDQIKEYSTGLDTIDQFINEMDAVIKAAK